MTRKRAKSPLKNSVDVESDLQDALGYLNFSTGKPDHRFQGALNRLHRLVGPEETWKKLHRLISDHLTHLTKTSAVFKDPQQATTLLALVFDEIWPAYRRHHADLLFHLSDEDFQQPFFLARMFEAALSQISVLPDTQRFVENTLARLNDFVGYRPIAVLEAGQPVQLYAHEQFRPIPLYLRDAGVAAGRYHDLILKTLGILSDTPARVLQDAHINLANLEELAVDVRAYDQAHPVYKRTNITFGEWDPHQIDLKGHYSRFVVRKIVLDALTDWMQTVAAELPVPEALFQAAAALCGTMLMASAISGSGPDTHFSVVTLISLLPKVARGRDAFYTQLLDSLSGPSADRLAEEAELFRQPFGRVRQHLNLFLADYGSRQLQHVHLALLLARMGYPQAAHEHAAVVPAASARFECEIQCCLTTANQKLDHGELGAAAELSHEITQLLHRGIECGALLDPWNILGFQGMFPLFAAREDSIVDPRVDRLLDLIEQIFALNSRLLTEVAAVGDQQLYQSLSNSFRRLADFWDQFATTTVGDLPPISGDESWESATHAAEALAQWRRAGEAAGDIAFWRQHVGHFHSAKAYCLVVTALLEKGDTVAAMGLLMQWLSEAEMVPLQSGHDSFHRLTARWISTVMGPVMDSRSPTKAAQRIWPTVKRFFDYLEANAGEFWSAPSLDDQFINSGSSTPDDAAPQDEQHEEAVDDQDDHLFQAAYDNVVYHDSAFDGYTGDTIGDHNDTSHEDGFDALTSQLAEQLDFLVSLLRLRQRVAATFAAVNRSAGRSTTKKSPRTNWQTDSEFTDTILHWHKHCVELLAGLGNLIGEVWNRESFQPTDRDESLQESDRQHQIKLELMRQLIMAHTSCQEASRMLLACLPEKTRRTNLHGWEKSAVPLYRVVLNNDTKTVRRLLPSFLKTLSRQPLLYTPLGEGGDPQHLMRIRALQSVIQFLLTQLPRLGLLRETWHVLKTAHVMERRAQRQGVSITEFDRLFRLALQNSLDCAIRSSKKWQAGRFSDDQLIQVIGEITDLYMHPWLEHSSTMRLSSVEVLTDLTTWREVKQFIRRYGGDLFAGGKVTLGSIRAVLQQGVEQYLDNLQEHEDPLHPIQLLEDLDVTLPLDEAAENLELVYRCLTEKIERFVEYNSTTTQSDYGEKIYILLAFLRLEADYDRQSWNMLPLVIAHEALARQGADQAALIWEEIFGLRTAELSDAFLRKLGRLERVCGVMLPSIRDRFNERFVKPLALDRILALVSAATSDAHTGRSSEAFEKLFAKINQYLQTTSGSGTDLPGWLQSLEREIALSGQDDAWNADPLMVPLRLPTIQISLTELDRQIDRWEKPLTSPGTTAG